MEPLILVADDAAFMRRMLCRTLAQGGYSRFLEAKNGEEALQSYQAHNPQLVLLDLTMPGRPGLEVLQDLLKLDPPARVVVCSAMGQEPVIRKALAAGAAAFLPKPFSPEELLAAVKQALGQRIQEMEEVQP